MFRWRFHSPFGGHNLHVSKQTVLNGFKMFSQLAESGEAAAAAAATLLILSLPHGRMRMEIVACGGCFL